MRAQRFVVRWSAAGSILAARQWGNRGQRNHLNRRVGDRPETRRSAVGQEEPFQMQTLSDQEAPFSDVRFGAPITKFMRNRNASLYVRLAPTRR